MPLLVGGAALSEKFTRLKIAPQYGTAVCYAKDAMTGLRLMNELSDPGQRDGVLEAHTHVGRGGRSKNRRQLRCSPRAKSARHEFAPICRFPPSPISTAKCATSRTCNEVWSYINPYMLFGRHLGFRGNFEKALAERDPRALELHQTMEEVKREAASFMKVRRSGNSSKPSAAEIPSRSSRPAQNRRSIHFTFQRQRVADKLCLSDYILEPKANRTRSPRAFRGHRRRGHSRKIRRSQSRRALSVLARPAGAGHRIRRSLRRMAAPPHSRRLGLPRSRDAMTMPERFTSRYRGKRYSFGYPACPNLDDQAGLWMLLRPEEIGVHLTEGMMMDPEASVSALVFQHPDCTYFSVGDQPETP